MRAAPIIAHHILQGGMGRGREDREGGPGCRHEGAWSTGKLGGCMHEGTSRVDECSWMRVTGRFWHWQRHGGRHSVPPWRLLPLPATKPVLPCGPLPCPLCPTLPYPPHAPVPRPPCPALPHLTGGCARWQLPPAPAQGYSEQASSWLGPARPAQTPPTGIQAAAAGQPNQAEVRWAGGGSWTGR